MGCNVSSTSLSYPLKMLILATWTYLSSCIRTTQGCIICHRPFLLTRDYSCGFHKLASSDLGAGLLSLLFCKLRGL